MVRATLQDYARDEFLLSIHYNLQIWFNFAIVTFLLRLSYYDESQINNKQLAMCKQFVQHAFERLSIKNVVFSAHAEVHFGVDAVKLKNFSNVDIEQMF